MSERVDYLLVVKSHEGDTTSAAMKHVAAQTRPLIGESVALGTQLRPAYGKVSMVYHQADGRLTVELECMDSDFITRLIKHCGWRRLSVET